MRVVLLAVLVAAPLSAQTTLRLVDPVLSVDGRRVTTTGAPLTQDPFGVLRIEVPGDGTYTVSERPFAGARRGGQFDGRGLYFAAAGRSVRLHSHAPILSLEGPVSAYVAFQPALSRRARGLARLAVADAVDGRSRRSGSQAQMRSARTGGPRPSLDDRPAASPPVPSEVQRLRGELSRVVSDRQRLAAERDRLARERDEALAARDASLAGRSRRDAAPRAEVEVLRAERDALAAERARLAAERTQLVAAQARAESERQRLASAFAALRARAETAEAQIRRSGSIGAGEAQEVERLRDQADRLRRELDARDRSLALLRAEVGNRAGRLPSVASDLSRVQAQLAEAVAARDRAFAARDAAYQQRDAMALELDAARAQADALRAQRDASRLNGSPAQTGLSSLDDERRALARDRALLNADRQTLAAERAAFENLRARADGTLGLAERQALLEQLADAQRQREALVAERDRLATELGALRAGPSSAGPPPSASAPDAEPVTIRTVPAARDGAIASLPGFDVSRLANPDAIRRRLGEAQYPHWATVGRIQGDVLVLFQTDASGRVIRTAVPTPIGGGLDGLAEEIVREMRFQPTVGGQGLRSQAVVRFEL